MRVVIQRVSSARVTIDGRMAGQIERGLLVFLGIESADTAADGDWLAQKIVRLRLFADDDAASPEQGRGSQMNKSVADIRGGILLISQFTLHASTQKGTRPSFNAAARPEQARLLYGQFIAQLTTALGGPIATGEFGAMMQVSLVNDGPVTLIIDSKQRV
jgi:D-tyrosyl-tRNA(Tyr) deacylase